MPASTNPLGGTTATSYDSDGLVVSSSGPAGGSSTDSYDKDGNVTLSVTPLGATTINYYDANDELTLSISPDGTTTYAYDSNGDVTLSISPSGGTTRNFFDGDGDVTLSIAPTGGTTTNYYDPNGDVTLSIFPLNGSTNGTTRSYYDVYGDLTMGIDPLGYTTSTTYDNDGDALTTISPSGTTINSYDSNGDLASVTSPTGSSSYGYDKAGNVTLSYSSGTGTTLNYYDSSGDVTMSVNADNATSLSYYDQDGDLTQFVDPSGNTTSYRYDSASQATLTITPLGTTLTLYDADNNVTQVVDADGRTTMMTYDNDDRVLSNADGSFGYNADGELTSASNASGTYLMQYDPEGQVTSVSEPFGVSLTFAYDDQGNRTLVADSLGGTQASVYDLDDRLTTLTYSGQSQSLSETLTYFPGGEVSTATLYSGVNLIATENYGIGGNDQVTSLLDKYANGTTLASYDYAYNSLNQLTQTIENGTTTSYSYDAAGELTGAGTQSYSYDANGSPTNLANTDQTGPDNELTQYVDPSTGDTWTYSYDQVGNRTQAIDAGATQTTTWDYGYDNANHMMSATEVIGGTAVQTSAYQYDAFGNLIQETVTTSSATTISRYAVDGWNPANAANLGTSKFTDWAILDGKNSNALITREIMSVGTQAGPETTPLARIDESGATDPAGVYWTPTDRLGSVGDVLDNTPNDTPVDQIQYDAYGNIISQTTGASNYLGAYAWDGYHEDAATGLYNNDARVYDPVSQQWLSQDPMGFGAGDNNLYRYVNNMPTEEVDRSGMSPIYNLLSAAYKAYLSQPITTQRVGGLNAQQKNAYFSNIFTMFPARKLDGDEVAVVWNVRMAEKANPVQLRDPDSGVLLPPIPTFAYGSYMLLGRFGDQIQTISALLVGVLSAGGAAADNDRVASERIATVVSLLNSFFRSPQISQRIQNEIRNLGDDRYQIRESARQFLSGVKWVASPELQAATRNADLEIAKTASQNLESSEAHRGA